MSDLFAPIGHPYNIEWTYVDPFTDAFWNWLDVNDSTSYENWDSLTGVERAVIAANYTTATGLPSVNTVKIELSIDDGDNWTTIDTGVLSSTNEESESAYVWTPEVPETLQGVIRITSENDDTIIKTSDNIGIYTPVPTYPRIDSITPSVGSVDGSTAITLTGDFAPDTSGVTVGGIACTGFVLVSSTAITCVTPALDAGQHDVLAISPTLGNATLAKGFTAQDTSPPPGPDTVMGMLIKLHKKFFGTEKIKESPVDSGRFYDTLYNGSGGENDTVIAACELKGYGGSPVASFVGNTSPCERLKSVIDVEPTIPENATVLGTLEKMINYEFGKKIQKEIPVGSGKFYEVTYDSAGTEIGRCPLRAYGGAEIASPEGSTEPVERLRSTI